MPIDPNEKLVYVGRPGERHWWTSGMRCPPPPADPRDFRWPLPDQHGTVLMLTLDLRTLKLYARFEILAPQTEAHLTSW